jgi:hypothetical protein
VRFSWRTATRREDEVEEQLRRRDLFESIEEKGTG